MTQTTQSGRDAAKKKLVMSGKVTTLFIEKTPRRFYFQPRTKKNSKATDEYETVLLCFPYNVVRHTRAGCSGGCSSATCECALRRLLTEAAVNTTTLTSM